MNNSELQRKHYDYLIVGSGLFGAVFAYRAKQAGKTALVLERRAAAGGNIRCEEIEGINVHTYGAHIFHTSNAEVWRFVNQIVEFNNYVNSPVANYHGKLYNLPFNMNTFHQMWGVVTPDEAKAKIAEQRREMAEKLEKEGVAEPRNLEEQAQMLVGRDIYEKLIKEYTEKQWGRKCTDLPAFIIKRLPVRLIFDNNYFSDRYQGVPIGGYNKLIDGLLDGTEVLLSTDYLKDRSKWNALADKVVYTGAIDEFYDFRFGKLEYRTVRFETELLDCENFQGNAVINYTSSDVPYTRIIEHKHFEFGKQPKTVISREYSMEWQDGMEPYYPVNDDRNTQLFKQYQTLAENEKAVIFGGRLAEYKYYDMDKVIAKALEAKI